VNHHDPFEERVRRQPLRAVPPEWREEILAIAEAQQRAVPCCEPALSVSLWQWLRELFWPAPQAWASLAAVWLVILAVNLITRDPAPTGFARHAAPATPLQWELLQEQQRLFAELVGPSERPAGTKARPLAPQPRSQRRDEFFIA